MLLLKTEFVDATRKNASTVAPAVACSRRVDRHHGRVRSRFHTLAAPRQL